MFTNRIDKRFYIVLVGVIIVMAILLSTRVTLFTNRSKPQQEVAGIIIEVTTTPKTSFRVEHDDWHYTGQLLKGLSRGDSVHHYPMADWQYFKKDDYGNYKEIEWYPVSAGIYEWQYADPNQSKRRKH